MESKREVLRREVLQFKCSTAVFLHVLPTGYVAGPFLNAESILGWMGRLWTGILLHLLLELPAMCPPRAGPCACALQTLHQQHLLERSVVQSSPFCSMLVRPAHLLTYIECSAPSTERQQLPVERAQGR